MLDKTTRTLVGRVGKALAIDPKTRSMSDAVAYMTGAKQPEVEDEFA